MPNTERHDPGKKPEKDAVPRQGSLRREVERAERVPEPHHGKQLIGPED